MCFPFFSKDEVTGSEVDEGRGERFVPETEKLRERDGQLRVKTQ